MIDISSVTRASQNSKPKIQTKAKIPKKPSKNFIELNKNL